MLYFLDMKVGLPFYFCAINLSTVEKICIASWSGWVKVGLRFLQLRTTVLKYIMQFNVSRMGRSFAAHKPFLECFLSNKVCGNIQYALSPLL